MLAHQIMTTDVVAVLSDTPTSEIARRLLDHKISAVPVIDSSEMVIGMVSEEDLIGRNDSDREERRDWWLSLIAEGEALHPDFWRPCGIPNSARAMLCPPRWLALPKKSRTLKSLGSLPRTASSACPGRIGFDEWLRRSQTKA
jgi:hypothetical protein